MNIVAATPDEINTMVCYRDGQQQYLKQTPFFSFANKRWYRDKIAEIDCYINAAKVTERVFSVPGFKRRISWWDESKSCYYTEINGLICEIDEYVHDDGLRIQQSATPQVTVRKCPDGEVCTAIIVAADIDRIEDISDAVSSEVPVRSVFPGHYESIVADINACVESFFPYGRPEYVNDDVYWFFFHNECANFAAAWGAQKDA